MDSYVDERDRKILENDKYTFFVLRRIMGGKCELLLTDHERLIVCFTGSPFPIWIGGGVTSGDHRGLGEGVSDCVRAFLVKRGIPL